MGWNLNWYRQGGSSVTYLNARPPLFGELQKINDIAGEVQKIQVLDGEVGLKKPLDGEITKVLAHFEGQLQKINIIQGEIKCQTK
jgi:hypothetical protein